MPSFFENSTNQQQEDATTEEMDMDNILPGPLPEEGAPIDAVPALPENELDLRDPIDEELVVLFVLTMNNNYHS